MRGIVVAWVALAANIALAQPHPKQAEIDKLFGEGRALIAKNEPNQACEVFYKAYELDTRAPGVLLNLGLCNEMQKKWGTALRWFRKALSVSGEEKYEVERAATEEHSSTILKVAASITIDVAGAPDDIVVKVDGEIVNKEFYPLYEIDNGERVVEATASGKRKFTKKLTVTEKSRQTVQIKFEEKQYDVVDAGKTRRILGIGVGILGLGTLGVSAGLANYWAKTGVPASQVVILNDKIDTIATPIAIAGAVVVAGGIILYLTAPKKERRERTVLLPVVGPDQAGFVVRGGF
jgi:sulfur carrier protein ThiS